MNEDVYPQDVDFNYKIRCSQHNFKPYVYCEMCMLRTDLQGIKEDTLFSARHMLAQTSLSVNILHDILEKHAKQIAELQIEIKLLRERK